MENSKKRFTRFCNFDDRPFYKVVVTYDDNSKDFYYFNCHSNNNHLLWSINTLVHQFKVIKRISVNLTNYK